MGRPSIFINFFMIAILFLSSCASAPTIAPASGLPRVLAVESFLADIAQNVAGNRLSVDSLIPLDVDPHAYQLTPQDAARITQANVLILGANRLKLSLIHFRRMPGAINNQSSPRQRGSHHTRLQLEIMPEEIPISGWIQIMS